MSVICTRGVGQRFFQVCVADNCSLARLHFVCWILTAYGSTSCTYTIRITTEANLCHTETGIHFTGCHPWLSVLGSSYIPNARTHLIGLETYGETSLSRLTTPQDGLCDSVVHTLLINFANQTTPAHCVPRLNLQDNLRPEKVLLVIVC